MKNACKASIRGPFRPIHSPAHFTPTTTYSQPSFSALAVTHTHGSRREKGKKELLPRKGTVRVAIVWGKGGEGGGGLGEDRQRILSPAMQIGKQEGGEQEQWHTHRVQPKPWPIPISPS